MVGPSSATIIVLEYGRRGILAGSSDLAYRGNMATASIRKAIPGLTRAIMALALAIAMIAAFVVAPAGHVQSDEFGIVSVTSTTDDGSASETGHATAACHGCLGHAAGVLSSPAFVVAALVTDADLASGNDLSPPTPALVPPVEPPRA